jgi:oxygen-dependent protoporphyrinogen oxidase
MTSVQRLGRVVIVGGGISGLAAAFALRDHGADVVVLEGSPAVGGKLAVSDIAGIAVDAGAEALLARRPEGVGLIDAIGLAGQLVYPGTTTSAIWTRGQFRALPRRQFMGVPADLDEVQRSAILSPAGMVRARQDAVLATTRRDGDVSVAAQVGARFGTEVVERLVDPLLGGVYAGRADQLSFEATLPVLARESGRHRSLGDATRLVLGPAADGGTGARPVTGQPGQPGQPPDPPAAGAAGTPAGAAGTSAGQPAPGHGNGAPGSPQPVFTTLAGGLGTLPEALARSCGAAVRTGAMVRELVRTEHGWRLTVGSAHAPEQIDADAVILAIPARPASRLLGHVDGPQASAAASALAGIGYASMAIVTLAYPTSAFPQAISGSGYLVPAVDGRPVKAVTFSTVKWPHLATPPARPRPAAVGGAGALHVVRCSIGRIGEEGVLQRDDGDLAELAAADLAAATGVAGRPVVARVTRWGGGLPQYEVGHLDRVRRIREQVAALPGLAVCGAAYDGIGIPACIASARLAAGQVLAQLRTRPAWHAPRQEQRDQA